MRELKFRIYSNYYKKYLDTSGKGFLCEVHHLALKPDGKLYYADIGIDYPGTLSECPTLDWGDDYEDCVVEQYTGLKDKNGKEIYEGDIVKYKLYADSRLDYIDEVFYSTISGAFMVGDEDNIRTLDCLINVEVIGNIHDDPGLLKEEK